MSIVLIGLFLLWCIVAIYGATWIVINLVHLYREYDIKSLIHGYD